MHPFRYPLLISSLLLPLTAAAGPYDPAAGETGSLAIPYDSPLFTGWATGFTNLVRGPMNISDPGLGNVSFGSGNNALGASDAEDNDSLSVVSLGDGGMITLAFANPITNGIGADFAVFENSITDDFLELAFVEVSSDGLRFERFPSVSLTQTSLQVDSYDSLDPTDLHNLAGKHTRGYGTPFDLEDLAALQDTDFDLERILYVRIIDVIGKFSGAGSRMDSQGHIVNDPWPTAFDTGGFDLDAVGVINAVPEPTVALLAISGIGALCGWRRRRQ